MTSAAKLWQRLTSASQSTRRYLSATAQTKRSWARVVDSPSSVPAIYQDQVRAISETHGCFPYTIVTPTYEGFLSKESEKIICAFKEILYVLTSSPDHPEPQAVDYSTITYVQHGSILLNSWLKLMLSVPDKSPYQLLFRFNSASERCLLPLIEMIRSYRCIESNPVHQFDHAKLGYLEQLDYKLYNYGVNCLLPSQRVRSTLYQPADQQDLILFHRTVLTRTISPAHLSILTDSELILVSDGEQANWHNQRRYGGVWSYVPLSMIDQVSVGDGSKDTFVLKYDLVNGESLTRKCQIGNQAEVAQFIQDI